MLHSEPIILKTKIEIPLCKQSLVFRDELTKSITKGLTGKLTSVCAPAGFGKSTLLSQWAQTNQDYLCAWLMLDPRDNDEVRFWRYAVHAIATVLTDVDRQKILVLANTLPSLSMITFLDAFINELFSVKNRIVLVLDDYHVIQQESIHESLTYFIDYLPENVHVIICSRAELPFSTIKWKAKQESHELTTSQLQFTIVEAEALYQQLTNTEYITLFSEQQIKQLVQLTEGWVTGLRLIALSMRERKDDSFEHIMENFKGTNYHIADYLFHEVVSKLPSDISDFLLNTSLLNRFNPMLCDTIFETKHSSTIFETIRRLNLFVIALDTEGTWFRYHHLFAQYLQARLKERDPAQWTKINRLASICFAEVNQLEEAIHHADQAKDYTLMESYLARHIPTVLEKGEYKTFLLWFNRFPKEYKLTVELSLLYAFVLTVTGNHQQSKILLKQLEEQVKEHNHSGDRKELQSGLLFVRSNLMFSSGDFAQWFEFTAGILDHILPENPTFYNFNYNLAEPFVRRTSLGLKGGLSRDMERIGQQFTSVLEKHGWQDSLINLYVKQTLCEGYYEWNQLDVCTEMLPRIEQMALHKKILGLLIPVRVTKAKLYMARGELHLAHATIAESIDFPDRSSHSNWTRILRACKARIYLQEGKVARAKQEVAKLGIASKDNPTFNREYEYMTLIRLLSKQRKEIEAIRLLELLRPQVERELLFSSMVELNILQGILEKRLGQQARAIYFLQQALTIAEKNDYIRSFLDEGEEMQDLLTLYLNQNQKDANMSLSRNGSSIDYVQKLIKLFPLTQTLHQTKKGHLVEELSRGEVRLLQQIEQGATNKQIGENLALSEGTVKVYLSRLYEKLGVSSRTQALLVAQKWKLLD